MKKEEFIQLLEKEKDIWEFSKEAKTIIELFESLTLRGRRFKRECGREVFSHFTARELDFTFFSLDFAGDIYLAIATDEDVILFIKCDTGFEWDIRNSIILINEGFTNIIVSAFSDAGVNKELGGQIALVYQSKEPYLLSWGI